MILFGGVASRTNSRHPAALSMRRLRPYLLLSLFLSAFVFAGCKGNCRKLAERLCDCAANNSLKDVCLQRAANEDSRVGTTPADEARCSDLLKVCDCHTTDTVQGKVNCGLARQP
jgi:hypothetical protein